MSGQKLPDALGFVGGEIVRYDVNLTSLRLMYGDVGKKSDELFTGMTRRSFANDLTGSGVQGRIERERAMSLVFETMTFRSTRRHRKNRVKPIQSLNGCLFVHAKHHSVLRRLQIQSNDVGGVRFAARLPRCLEYSPASRSAMNRVFHRTM